MWDLVGNPEDRFSQNEAHLKGPCNPKKTFVSFPEAMKLFMLNSTEAMKSILLINEPRSEKTGLRVIRPGPTKTGLCNH